MSHTSQTSTQMDALKSYDDFNRNNLSQLIEFWQDHLNLHHWKIDTRLTSTQFVRDKQLMTVTITRRRNHALIKVSNMAFVKPQEEFSKLVLHEVMHLVLDPLVEEHDFQVEFGLSLKGEYKARFKQLLEKQIDHLTEAFFLGDNHG